MHEEIVTLLINHILLKDRQFDIENCRKELTKLGFYDLDTLTRENLILRAHNKVAEMYIQRDKNKKKDK